MNAQAELRRTYLGAAPHTLTLGSVWIASGLLADFAPRQYAVMFFLTAVTLHFPLGEGLRKLLKAEHWLGPHNTLPQLLVLFSLLIPLSYPLLYLACRSNVNALFPAFSLLIGMHYLPFMWALRMPSFAFLSGLLVLAGGVCALLYPASFTMAAYVAGMLLVSFGALHLWIVREEIAQEYVASDAYAPQS